MTLVFDALLAGIIVFGIWCAQLPDGKRPRLLIKDPDTGVVVFKIELGYICIALYCGIAAEVTL